MIVVDGFRLTGISVDMSGKNTTWRLSGYYLTTAGRIFGTFIYSTNPLESSSGFGFFTPNHALESLSSLIFEEAHTCLESFIWKEYEPKDDKETKEAISGLGPQNDPPVAKA